MSCKKKCYYRKKDKYKVDEYNSCEVFDSCKHYNDFQDDMQKLYSWHIVDDKLILGEVRNAN